MTITKDRIKAELDAFIEWPGDYKSAVSTVSCLLFAEHVARMVESELGKDADRYRFLKDQGHFRAMSMDMGGNHSWTGMGRHVGKGETIDAAIDAAMSTKPE